MATKQTHAQHGPVLAIARPPSPVESPLAASMLAPGDRMPGDIRRLVVLVPDGDVETAALAAALDLLEAALAARASEVLFLGLSPNPEGDWRARARLADLAGEAQRLDLTAQAQVLGGSRWLGAVRQVVRPGDLIVCHAGQAPGTWYLGRRRLAELLAAKLDVPVYQVSGLYKPLQPWAWLLYEAALVAIVAGFSWMELRADMTMVNPVKALTLIVLLWSELGLIFVWNLLRNNGW